MTAKEYIEEFNMLEESYPFNRHKFISQLRKDFLENCNRHQPFGYNDYIAEVNNIHELYKEISEILRKCRNDGKGLTKQLWGLFYAKVILKVRANVFPEEHQIIAERIKKRTLKKYGLS